MLPRKLERVKQAKGELFSDSAHTPIVLDIPHCCCCWFGFFECLLPYFFPPAQHTMCTLLSRSHTISEYFWLYVGLFFFLRRLIQIYYCCHAMLTVAERDWNFRKCLAYLLSRHWSSVFESSDRVGRSKVGEENVNHRPQRRDYQVLHETGRLREVLFFCHISSVMCQSRLASANTDDLKLSIRSSLVPPSALVYSSNVILFFSVKRAEVIKQLCEHDTTHQEYFLCVYTAPTSSKKKISAERNSTFLSILC